MVDIAVAIVEAGRIVRNDDAETVVPWWSFTKTLIAAAALALARDGALRLDDLSPGRPYSLRLLLQHRAGLADYGGLKSYHDAVSRDEPPGHIRPDAQADAERLRYEPGQGWGYSNIGYLLARQHLEALCGENLDALLRRLVFDPLGIAGPRVALDAQRSRWRHTRKHPLLRPAMGLSWSGRGAAAAMRHYCCIGF